MTGGCPDFRGELAAYLLAALDPAGTAAVERHLAGCPGCALEFAELAPLPALLAEVPRGRLTDEPGEAGEHFADRLLAAAARTRRRRRRRLAAAAAGMVVAAGAAGTGVGLSAAGGSRPATLQVSDPATGASARIVLQPRATGTGIDMSITGVPSQARCTLVAVARGGGRDVAGGWQATYSGTAHIEGSTAIPERRLVELLVETSNGERLLTVHIPAAG